MNRVLIARLGVFIALLAVVWVVIDARGSATSARRQLAEQSDPTSPGSLAFRLAEAEAARAELVADLDAARASLDGLGRQVDKLPTKFPTPAPAPSTPPARTYVTVEPGPAGSVVLRPVQAPSTTPRTPSPAPSSTRRPTPASPAPAPSTSPCLVAVLGVGVCPDG